jgi:hypothetical protein
LDIARDIRTKINKIGEDVVSLNSEEP